VLRIRIHLIRIQGFDDQKWKKKNLQLNKNFDQKLQFTYPYASIKDVQVTKEAFSYQKRISSTSKHEISYFFLLLWVLFALLDPYTDPNSEYGSGSTDLIISGSNTDPDPDPQHR